MVENGEIRLILNAFLSAIMLNDLSKIWKKSSIIFFLHIFTRSDLTNPLFSYIGTCFQFVTFLLRFITLSYLRLSFELKFFYKFMNFFVKAQLNYRDLNYYNLNPFFCLITFKVFSIQFSKLYIFFSIDSFFWGLKLYLSISSWLSPILLLS